MTTQPLAATSEHESKDVAITLLKLGATSYGGPAIMGFMQAELQERRQWVTKERFLEGLAVANMVPGATATQLGIFLAYARSGWWGGLLGGLCHHAYGHRVDLSARRLCRAAAVLSRTHSRARTRGSWTPRSGRALGGVVGISIRAWFGRRRMDTEFPQPARSRSLLPQSRRL